MPRWVSEHSLGAAVLLVLLAAPLCYIVCIGPPGAFWDNVMSEFLATVVALVGGIPAALWVDREIRHREERKRLALESEKEEELLVLLGGELASCRRMIQARMQDPSGDAIDLVPLRSDLWDAASAGGQLALIQEPALLDMLATVYGRISLVQQMEVQARVTLRTPEVLPGGVIYLGSPRGAAAKQTWEDARRFDEELVERIGKTLDAIHRRASNQP